MEKAEEGVSTLSERLALFDSMTAKARSIMIARAEKYSGAKITNNEDSSKNLRACESYGISAIQGVITRMSDKLARLGNLALVQDEVGESVEDTCLDLLNYAVCVYDLYYTRSSPQFRMPSEYAVPSGGAVGPTDGFEIPIPTGYTCSGCMSKSVCVCARC
jgi:hypothetical protein